MPAYNRMQHIAECIELWRTQSIRHEPIHPHLSPDTKSFGEAFALGRLMEDLVRPLLFRQFPQARILAHCDTTLAHRSAGKRAWIAGQDYILPDFEIYNPDGLSCCIDIKSKQYHSYYHIEDDVQQFIDGHPLHDYLTYASSAHIAPLILFHLWPAVAMHVYGKEDVARIHTGIRQPVLSHAKLTALLQQYPVDDVYYLVHAKKFLLYGREGRMDGDRGYYLSLSHMQQGLFPGKLPITEQWQKESQQPVSMKD